MRLPRPRFTLRWLMVFVALAAMTCGAKVLLARRADFARRSASWRWTEIAESRDRRRPEAIARFGRLSTKYAHAARYPWLPVVPDPPEPR